ncbi:hypothetical protein [Spirillospora albida]|uniref:hypothetical protein n=1 Tax=Spirillospora albida TaxID=58123 RepID=UPI0014707BF1|nr:hypothetical protein [Spirillospora albida]
MIDTLQMLVINKRATGQNTQTVTYSTARSRKVCLIQSSRVVDRFPPRRAPDTHGIPTLSRADQETA